MTELIDTTEMYLKTILELTEEGTVPMRARIVERLEQSGPTVSQTVARLERDGYLVVTGDRRLALTAAGGIKAARVMRKHRLAERLLNDVIKMDWWRVHSEACRWEHVMSADVERLILGLLDQPYTDPYGNPIPGLSELIEDSPTSPPVPPADPSDRLMNLTDAVAAGDGPRTFTLERIEEPAQADARFLQSLHAANLLPGATFTSGGVTGDGSLVVEAAGASEPLEIAERVARHLVVRAH